MSTYQNPFSNRKHFYEHQEWIDAHLAKFFDEDQISVFHEIPTLDLHLDIYLIQPKETDYNILITSGMSLLKMNITDQMENPNDFEFSELMMMIPKSIEFGKVYTGKNKNDWILSVLKKTAKFPHFYNTWIGVGHTIQAEEDLTPYGKDTDYVGAVILPSVTYDKDFTEIHRNGHRINIYSVFPLYKNELEFKVKNGYHKFLDVLIKANNTEMLDVNRENLFPQKSFWNRVFGN